MAAFLKFVSGIYLTFVWLVVFLSIKNIGTAGVSDPTLYQLAFIIIGVGLTVPAALIFAFGTLVGDTKKIREHLAAIRRYYEPGKL